MNDGEYRLRRNAGPAICRADISRVLSHILLIPAAVFLSVKAALSGSILYIAGLCSIPFVVYFSTRPVYLFITMYLVDLAQINVPGLWANVSLANLLQLFFVGVCFAQRIIKKNATKTNDFSSAILLIFIVNMLLVMFVRGAGLRVFGGELHGGMGYVSILLAYGVYTFAPDHLIKEKQVQFCIYASIVAGCIPALIQLLFVLTGGKFYILAFFIQADLEYVAKGVFSTISESITRFSSARTMAFSIITFALIYPFKRWRVWSQFFLLSIAGIVVLLSGFRSALLEMMVILSIWYYTEAKKNEKVLYVILAFAGVILGWLFLVLYGQQLPLAIQRSISWVPGVTVSYHAISDATFSTAWRLQIWEYMIKDIPSYLLLGKGFCYPVDFTHVVDKWENARPYMHFLRHNYHNGGLSLLLDLGIVGFATGMLLLLVVSIEAFRGLKFFPEDNILRRFYKVMSISLVWSCFASVFIAGSAHGSIPKILLAAALLRLLRYSAMSRAC